MNKIKVTTTDGTQSFEIPFDWIESTGVTPVLNDLEAKAERGITTGYLFRVRQAEIPSMKLKINKSLTQAQVYPLLSIIRQTKFKLYYFEKYENAFKTIDVYCKKPDMAVKEYPTDNNTDNIVYEPFEIQFTAYGGI